MAALSYTKLGYDKTLEMVKKLRCGASVRPTASAAATMALIAASGKSKPAHGPLDLWRALSWADRLSVRIVAAP
jgi:hypothetical protein